MEQALEAARRSGLVVEGEPLLVLLSGGPDSVCLLDVAVRLGAEVSALHVNYGLRAGAAGDEELCRELCAPLGVPLAVERVDLAGAVPDAPGNLQAEARDARYALAEAHVERRGGDYAAAHTASDQAETVIYRLAVSPGRRALLGMEPRRGRLVRPLLGVASEGTRSYCADRRLEWREDPSNQDLRFARSRVRHEVLPALERVSSAAERTIAETALLLRDEAEVLERAVDEALGGAAGSAIPVAELTRLPAALARLALRRLGESAAGEARSLSRAEADAILALGASGGTRSLDLGGGLRATVEYGVLRFSRAPEEAAPAPGPVRLAVPGSVRFGNWRVEARPADDAETRAPSDGAVLSAAAVGDAVTVRTWRNGDRMRPAGLGGTKTLQDLFTDRKVPRALRRTLPVVEARGGIVWVAGVAVADDRSQSGARVRLSARRT